MPEAAFILGIDVSKAKLDTCLLDARTRTVLQRHTWRNDSPGVSALCVWLNNHTSTRGPVHAALESTGSYSRRAHQALLASGHPVSLLNAARVKAWTIASGQRNKPRRLAGAETTGAKRR